MYLKYKSVKTRTIGTKIIPNPTNNKKAITINNPKNPLILFAS